ncbi:DUF1259 domain-containing protein [Myxococcus xanthus]|nr:DUF1259 domain-containing protein [Myxococcus xanthus]
MVLLLCRGPNALRGASRGQQFCFAHHLQTTTRGVSAHFRCTPSSLWPRRWRARRIGSMCTYFGLNDSKFGRIKTAGFERLLAGITLNPRADKKRLARASTCTPSSPRGSFADMWDWVALPEVGGLVMMLRSECWKCLALVVALLFTGAAHAQQRKGDQPKDVGIDTADIERRTGAKGELSADEGVFKVNLPRTDLKVGAAGVKLIPPLGLTAWAAFKRVGDATMVMGDIVLLEDQVNPVMDVALQNGLEVTALHNHFFWEQPKVMFMHISGMGETARLADAVGKVFTRLRETAGGKGRVPRASVDPARSKLDVTKLDALLGQKGTSKDGVYKVTVGRTVRIYGHEMGKAMGVNTWAAFAGTPQQAVVDGDFAILESELQPVLKALRAANIDIVAIHNHMTGEEPRMLFLHYWGVGPADALARGVRSAMELTLAPTGP